MIRQIPYFRLVFAIVCLPVARAQDVRFERISLEQGLSQSSVLSIVQDHQGFLWFATQDGVNRYDGYSFRVFRPDLKDSNSLSSNFCGPMLVDRRGRIWIGTEATGVDVFDPKTYRFRNFRHQSGLPSSLSSNGVGKLAEDATGSIWLGTAHGLNLLDPESGSVRRFFHVAGDPLTLPGNQITGLFRDSQNRIWIGTDGGLCRYDSANDLFVRYGFDTDAPLVVLGFGENEQGTLWTVTTRGLFVIGPEGRMSRSAHRFFEGKNLLFILPGDDGILWIGSNIGLIGFHPATSRIEVHQHRSSDPGSPSANSIISGFRDRSGVLWFGTFNGINRYSPGRIKFRTYRLDPPAEGIVGHNNVRSICEDHTGTVWIGTMGGLTRFRATEGFVGRYAAGPGQLSSNVIWSVREERRPGESTVWAGTNAHGVNEIILGRDGLPRFRHHLAGRSIASIEIDPAGGVWAGDIGGQLHRLDRGSNGFRLYDSGEGRNRVALHTDRDGDLWIGSLGNGVRRDRPSTGDIWQYRHDPSNPSSLSNDHAIAFHEDEAGTMWIGTYAGLNRFDGSTSTFRRYTMHDGLPNDVIYAILGDDSGHLWLSTNKGLSRFDPATETFRNFDVSDGLQDNEFNQGAAYRARNGEMYFGGINGFSVFHPDSIVDNPNRPAVVFTDFKLFNRSVGFNGGMPLVLDGPVEHASGITLSYRDNVFSFEYAALEFTNPARNRYAYMMEGFDGGWIDAGTRREITYTNLDPGRYVFRVKAANNDGVWNEQGASLSIVITPPFWMTWWFRGILITGFLLVGPAIYFRRVRGLKREQRIQQEFSEKLIASQEAERKRIAAELHDSVGQDLLIIKNKILFGLEAGNGSKEQGKEFREASEHVSKSLKDVREISRNLRPAQLDQIGLTAAIESVVETIAEASHLKTSLLLENADNLLSKDAEIHLFRIVQEGLNNIVKHSGASEFIVELTRAGPGLTVRIMDNGKGMRMGGDGKRGGLGLSGMGERARILGGELDITSMLGKGTTIVLTVPLPSKVNG